jgi:hypothetical protein
MFAAIKNLFCHKPGKITSGSSSIGNRARPRVEQLEDRMTPSTMSPVANAWESAPSFGNTAISSGVTAPTSAAADDAPTYCRSEIGDGTADLSAWVVAQTWSLAWQPRAAARPTLSNGPQRDARIN